MDYDSSAHIFRVIMEERMLTLQLKVYRISMSYTLEYSTYCNAVVIICVNATQDQLRHPWRGSGVWCGSTN